MGNNQKKILTGIFLVGNIFFWIFVVFPIFVKFYQTLTKPVSLSVDTVPRPQTSGRSLQRIDFYSLRDPFSLPRKKTPKKIHRIAPHSEQPKKTSSRYVSAFKLNSIVQLEGRNFASLQRKNSSSKNNATPYSYRFGPQVSAPKVKSENVFEGDVIDGEKVIKITKDSVILFKNKQYYKLTFSGGYPVSKP